MFHSGLADILATVFGLIVLVASSLAVARSALVKAQLEALRGDRDDLKDRVDRLEHEKDEQAETIKAQNAKIQTLESVVTGREQLDKIIVLLANNERRAERMEGLLVRLNNAHP